MAETARRIRLGGRRGSVVPLSRAALAGGDVSIPPSVLRRVHRNRERQLCLILLLVLPLFGQFFHYMIDAGPFYYLSKAWPFMTLPLAVYGLASRRTPHHPFYILCLAYTLGVTPVLSIFWLGNSVIDAAGTTIKIWPLTYFFSLLALLTLMRPPPHVLRRALILLGFASIAVIWVLWAIIPRSSYATDPTLSKLFMYENERGYRIYMPETFTILLMFFATYRMMARQLKPWHVAAVLLGFACLVMIYKQRITIVATAGVIGWIVFSHLPRFWRSIGLILSGLGAAAGLVYFLRHLGDVTQSLGGSLSIRQNSMNLLWKFLSDEPARWLFGVGGATRFGTVTMAQIIGRKDFYLADLGWAGVLFEYGVIGSLLLFSLYLAALRWPERNVLDDWAAQGAGEDRSLYQALRAYALFLLLATAVYSPVFTPGELASVTAMLVYLAQGVWRPRRLAYAMQQPR